MAHLPLAPPSTPDVPAVLTVSVGAQERAAKKEEEISTRCEGIMFRCAERRAGQMALACPSGRRSNGHRSYVVQYRAAGRSRRIKCAEPRERGL